MDTVSLTFVANRSQPEAYILGVPCLLSSQQRLTATRGGALALAEPECSGETDPDQKSIHEQIVQYNHQHGIK